MDLVTVVIGAVGDLFAAVAVVAAVLALRVAGRTFEAGKDTTRELGVLVRSVQDAAEQIGATVEAVERMRREERLLQRLDQYERVNAAVQTIMLALPGAGVDPPRVGSRPRTQQDVRIKEAQASMRASLAVVPGVSGAAGSRLYWCWRLSRCPLDPQTGRPSSSVSEADIEIEAAIREIHERLQEIITGQGGLTVPRPSLAGQGDVKNPPGGGWVRDNG